MEFSTRSHERWTPDDSPQGRVLMPSMMTRTISSQYRSSSIGPSILSNFCDKARRLNAPIAPDRSIRTERSDSDCIRPSAARRPMSALVGRMAGSMKSLKMCVNIGDG